MRQNESCDLLINVNRVYLPETCAHVQRTVRTSVPWGRFSELKNCAITQSIYSKSELQMRRKAEALQYKKNSTNPNRNQRYVNNVRNGKTSISRLERLRGGCTTIPTRIEASASASGVPGGGTLWLNRSIPYVPIGKEFRPSYGSEETGYL